MSRTGALSEPAMERTLSALRICAEKIKRRNVTRMRCIATQACRGASNGAAFLSKVERETGLAFDVISTEEEARLAVMGSVELLDPTVKACLIFDIGGGSTELSWVRPGDKERIEAWTSLSFGVVSLAERWGGADLDGETYEAMVEDVRAALREADGADGFKTYFEQGAAHLLGTSGTVTSIAGVHLGLERYRRVAVDGLWLKAEEARAVSRRLLAMTNAERANEPCIGPDRADLVVCGCAILEALLREWPSDRIRVADRGLREGVLAGLAADARRARRRRRRRRKRVRISSA